jgi:hypothetical protein
MAARSRLSRHHSCSFDHLVGAKQEQFRQLEAERFRGFEIDDQLVF